MEKKSIIFEKNGRPRGLRTWIEVDTSAIKYNFELVKKLSPDTLKMAVVKSNAYGFGLFDYSKYIIGLGADWLGVDSVVEAIALRKSGIEVPILVLGYTLPERYQEAVDTNISLTISSFESLRSIMAAHLTGALNIHIKIDTGLHRQGFLESDIDELLTLLETSYSLNIEGIYTHFSDAKRSEGESYTSMQIENFQDIKDRFLKAGFKPIAHTHASAGLVRHGSKHLCDMVRIGASYYGIWPSVDFKNDFGESFPLKQALSWKTVISEIKKLPAGTSVGYGRTEVLTRDSVLAICPVGYWHGYPGTLSSCGEVSVGGKTAKVIGRVTMDIITIDITDCQNVAVNDVVTLIGDADGIAAKAGISAHELLTRLNPRIVRIYL